MSEVPTQGQKPEQKSSHLRLVSSADQTSEADFERSLTDVLWNESYSDEYIESRWNDLKSNRLSRLFVSNLDAKERPNHIITTVLNDIHAMETPAHEALVQQLIDTADQYLTEKESDEDSLIDLREAIGVALFEDHASTNLVRLLDHVRTDSQLDGDAVVQAWRLAGLMLILAAEKYHPTNSD